MAAGLTAARDVAELPAFVGIRGEAPGPGLSVRVPAVVHLQVLVWESERAGRVLIELHIYVPGDHPFK